MADQGQNAEQGGIERYLHYKPVKNTAKRRVTEVDFEEMNFEQRRVPYNSCNRIISEKDSERNPDENGKRNKPHDS